MTAIKNYTPFMSREPSNAGRFDISVTPPKDNPWSIDRGLEMQIAAEKHFAIDVVKIIEQHFHLKRSLRKEGTLETKALYETAEGILVEIVQDQFEGLLVESKDKEIIQKIYQELVKLQT